MSPFSLDQSQFETLSQLLAAGGHHDVHDMLSESLARLVTFWPAQAGALIYISPGNTIVRLEHGTLSHEARIMIEQARTSFARRDESGEPALGYYSLEGGFDLLELPLQSGNQGVGLLHLVVAETTGEKHGTSPTTSRLDGDMMILLVRSIGGEADKLARLQQAERDLRELRLLYEVGQLLTINLDLNSLLNEIRERVPEVVEATRCSIFLFDRQRNELVIDMPEQNRTLRMPADRGIAGWVAIHGVPQIVNDVEQDPRWYETISIESNFQTRSLVCVPIRVRNKTIGVMQLLNKRGNVSFDDKDVQLLSALAAQAGIAIENARLYRDLKHERDKLLNQEEHVRNSIARDLHDGPTQRLTAVMMNIEFIKKLLVAMPERVASELDTLENLVQRTITDLRTFLFELRPLGLETQGLLSTLQQYVQRWRDPSGQDIRLRLEAPASIPRLPHEVEGNVFVIIQEAVNNARKHARTPEIIIYLYIEEGHLVANVRDRGRGFDVRTIEATYNERGSLGLLSMRERAHTIGAEIRIRSEPGAGTTVELRIPLSDNQQ
ncbi:MAG: GAF domain-containing sensor histidine kinase [Chloroflexaceae bacterium]|nr:GAF domain-containing sensor histidine kinase [Chloroflexaceae bacterium]NJO05578.1 GAF domain-containing sensor histidine kinase [Chloroflexaceae bacterium]